MSDGGGAALNAAERAGGGAALNAAERAEPHTRASCVLRRTRVGQWMDEGSAQGHLYTYDAQRARAIWFITGGPFSSTSALSEDR